MKKPTMFVLGLAALFVLASCAVPSQIDAPDLRLNLGPAPPPRITQVEITNGAGKTVMSGRPSVLGELNSNPDLADLDGTLTIKSTWNTGEMTTQTATHTPNTPLAITYDGSRAAFTVTEIPANSIFDKDEDLRGGK